MAQQEPVCACGRQAVDVVRVASDDGLLLIRVCAECVEDPVADDQRELFEPTQRRPLTALPRRDDDRQPSLPFDDASDKQRGAA